MCSASTRASGGLRLFKLGFVVWFVCYSLGICKIITLLQWDRKTLKPDAKIKLPSVPHSPESHLKTRIFFLILFIYLFIFGCVGSSFLCEAFLLLRRAGGYSSLRCAGVSLSRPLLLRSTGSRRAGSVVVSHGPSCSAACGILPDQGSNPCPVHWQADSQPLRHQGSPEN